MEEESDTCHRCGEEGHYQEDCYAYIKCDFCHTKTHNTIACKSYRNFVKSHLIASSRRNTPLNGENKQRENKQKRAEQYRPPPQTRRDHIDEAPYSPQLYTRQGNLDTCQNQIALNTSGIQNTRTSTRIQTNTSSHNCIHEQLKRESNQNPAVEQTHYMYQQAEKPAQQRILSNVTH